jgi:prophage DNA circulation protein
MGSILDIESPWRAKLLPATFKGAEFHTEVMTEDSGRRLVVHEFPKKDRPYTEDMGRRAMTYQVRGYCISYVRDTAYPIYQRDYTISRDLLRDVLDAGGPGRLQLPSIASVIVACDRYRLTEETKLGGYCTFDMQFTEQGVLDTPPTSSRVWLMDRAYDMRRQVLANLAPPGDQPLLDSAPR